MSEIVDKNLERIIKLKLCTEEINNLEQIEEICVQDINLMEKKLNIDLKEISKLKNLKRLSLKFFDITDEVVDVLNNLEYLEEIEFDICNFKTEKNMSDKILYLSVYNCTEFKNKIINNCKNLLELEIVHSGLININELREFSNLKFLRLSDCNVISLEKINLFKELEELYLNNIELYTDLEISGMDKLIYISLNGSKTQNREEYKNKILSQKQDVEIEFEDSNLPIE